MAKECSNSRSSLLYRAYTIRNDICCWPLYHSSSYVHIEGLFPCIKPQEYSKSMDLLGSLQCSVLICPFETFTKGGNCHLMEKEKDYGQMALYLVSFRGYEQGCTSYWRRITSCKWTLITFCYLWSFI